MKPNKPNEGKVINSMTSEPGSKDDVMVVVVGASAGGMEAFIELLSHLPTDTGMAFVFVQHLDPKHESILTELISRYTKMAVREVKDGMGIESNHVYVIPPNTTMTVEDGRLRLNTREELPRQHMVVDLCMRSLAQVRGNKAVGVILSGTGSDGTLGLAEIQGQGGVTFVQDETAKFNGMPQSAIAAGYVDFVLPPAEIAAELTRIARHPYITHLATDATVDVVPEQHVGLDTIFQLIRRSTGVDFTNYRHSTIRRRIQRRMIVHKIETFPNYVKYLQQNPAEVNALYQDMLINVTSFFRNPSVFEALKTMVFPILLKDRSGDTPIRLWSAGCSSGEEAYSLAICLLEFLGDKAASTPIQIIGSDVSEVSINKARNGLYPENIQGDVSPGRMRRCFTAAEGGYRTNKIVREMCLFATHNLLIDPPFSQLDLICCRNVLIYMEPALQAHLISTFHYALKPHGFLLLGNSEGVGTMTNLFQVEDRANRIYSRISTAVRPQVAFSISRRLEQQTGTGARPRLAGKVLPSLNIADVQKEFDRKLLERVAPAAVFIDEALQVVHSRGNVNRYLKLPNGRASLSILKMIHDGLLLELRNAIIRAQKDNTTVHREHVELKADQSIRDVNFEVIPLRTPRTPQSYLMILFEEAKRERPLAKGRVPRKESSSKRADKLQRELDETAEYLQTVIESQEGTNEELQSANEEVLSSNEELQSTNEELETAKEELQSTNEELSTVNDELRRRNQEITSANNDLKNLLDSIDVAAVMLGSDLTIRRFTLEAQRILGLLDGDVGRPFENINTGFNVADLRELVVRVVTHLIPVKRAVRARSGKSYFLRITPYRTTENKVQGIVLTLTENQEEAAATEHPMEFMLVLDTELRVRAATPSFYRAFKLSPEAILNQRLDRLNHVVGFDNPELREALRKALHTSEAVGPVTLELKMDEESLRGFECRIERMAQDLGVRMITLSMQPAV